MSYNCVEVWCGSHSFLSVIAHFLPQSPLSLHGFKNSTASAERRELNLHLESAVSGAGFVGSVGAKDKLSPYGFRNAL